MGNRWVFSNIPHLLQSSQQGGRQSSDVNVRMHFLVQDSWQKSLWSVTLPLGLVTCLCHQQIAVLEESVENNPGLARGEAKMKGPPAGLAKPANITPQDLLSKIWGEEGGPLL